MIEDEERKDMKRLEQFCNVLKKQLPLFEGKGIRKNQAERVEKLINAFNSNEDGFDALNALGLAEAKK